VSKIAVNETGSMVNSNSYFSLTLLNESVFKCVQEKPMNEGTVIRPKKGHDICRHEERHETRNTWNQKTVYDDYYKPPDLLFIIFRITQKSSNFPLK
jgi:hypothetical protein